MFIVKQGILRRGTLVGAVAAALFMAASRGDRTLDSGTWHSIVLAALCFLEWTIGGGWLIGSVMWSMREQAGRRSRDRRF
jgi:hypothetical protein